MLILDNPDLPQGDSLTLTPAPLFQLYLDGATEQNGVVVTVDKGANLDAEAESLPTPIGKGFYYRITTDRIFSALSKIGFTRIQSPLDFHPNQFWEKSSKIGIYSVNDIAGVQSFGFSSSQVCRNLDSELSAILTIADVNPTTVESGGYTYQEGTGEDQWSYSDPTLTIKTSTSSRIAPGQNVNISGSIDIEVPAAIAQVLTFKLDEEDAVLGIEHLGVSFTEAVDPFNVSVGEFTISREGLLNLYFPLETSLPGVATEPVTKNLVVNTATLTYPRS